MAEVKDLQNPRMVDLWLKAVETPQQLRNVGSFVAASEVSLPKKGEKGPSLDALIIAGWERNPSEGPDQVSSTVTKARVLNADILTRTSGRNGFEYTQTKQMAGPNSTAPHWILAPSPTGLVLSSSENATYQQRRSQNMHRIPAL